MLNGKPLKHPEVGELVAGIQRELADVLAPLERPMSDDEMRRQLSRFDAGVEGNFIMWMGQGIVGVRSPQARFAIEENLVEETRENHPELLRAFCAQVKANPTAEDFTAVASGVRSVREVMKDLNGVDLLTMMIVFEHCSLLIMPKLEQYAKALGARDLSYTELHQAADIEHSSMFVWALDNELDFYSSGEIARAKGAVRRAMEFVHSLIM